MENSEQKNIDNPRETANVFSILTFWYSLDLFRRCNGKVLQAEDLYKPLSVDRSSSLGDRLEK